MLEKIKKFPGLVSLQANNNFIKCFKFNLFFFQTVLESNSRDPVQGPIGDADDFELWDYSQMLRHQQRYKWNNGTVCKPSCIPIFFILILIILVVLLPLLDSHNEKIISRNGTLHGWNCYDECK